MSEERGRKREGEGEEGKEGGSRSTRSEREGGGVIGKKKKNLISRSLWGGGDHLNPSVTICTPPPVKEVSV